MKATSFVSEHTAEYVLVPQFTQILATVYSKVIPFYFWASREGSPISEMSGPQEGLRLVCVYPRRPKRTQLESNEIFVKFNDVLFYTATSFETLGIPVFAGVPLAMSIGSLSSGTKCAWFRIRGARGEVDEPSCCVSPCGEIIELLGDRELIEGPLSPEVIRSLVLRATRLMSWPEAVFAIRESREGKLSRGRPPFFGMYKPFYVLLVNTD